MVSNPLTSIKQELIGFIHQLYPDAVITVDDFSTPPKPELGDLAFGCFMVAKVTKLAPGKIAADLAAALFSETDIITKAIAAGPYVNFFINQSAFVSSVAATSAPAIPPGPAAGSKAMVEYVSPNNNKPLHLGHVRNGAIGAAIANLLEARGAKVVRSLVLNDRGMAIAKAMVAYSRWANGATPTTLDLKGDHYLGDLYVQYDKAEKAGDKTLEDEAHNMIKKWEDGDSETRALWQMLGEWCEAGQHATYNRLGFHFDIEYKESELYLHGKELVEEGLAKGIFIKDETGAVIAQLEEHGLPNKVVLRADGTSLYITQDLYLAKKKADDEQLDTSIYVVANEQNLHFKQLFKILELLGYPWASKLRHLSYGLVTLPEGRMKSREGTVVDADDLLTSLETDAATEIRQRYPDLADEAVGIRAHQVAIAAVKFHFLEVDIASDSVYDPKESLSFNGRTGPYVQYMHARIASILRKADATPISEAAAMGVVDGEFRLAVTIAEYPEAVAKAADQLRPSLVALHLYTVAKAVAAFYEDVPVLSANLNDRTRRLQLLSAASNALRHGLNILGIEAPEEM